MFPSCPVESKNSYLSLCLLILSSCSSSLLVFYKYSNAIILNLTISSNRVRNERIGIYFLLKSVYYFLDFINFYWILASFSSVLVFTKFLFLDFQLLHKTLDHETQSLLGNSSNSDSWKRFSKFTIMISCLLLQFYLNSQIPRAIQEIVVLFDLIEYSQAHGPTFKEKFLIITGMVIGAVSGFLTSNELVVFIKYKMGSGKSMCIVPPFVYIGDNHANLGWATIVDVIAWFEILSYWILLKGVKEDYKRNLELEVQDVLQQVQRTFNLDGAQ